MPGPPPPPTPPCLSRPASRPPGPPCPPSTKTGRRAGSHCPPRHAFANTPSSAGKYPPSRVFPSPAVAGKSRSSPRRPACPRRGRTPNPWPAPAGLSHRSPPPGSPARSRTPWPGPTGPRPSPPPGIRPPPPRPVGTPCPRAPTPHPILSRPRKPSAFRFWKQNGSSVSRTWASPRRCTSLPGPQMATGRTRLRPPPPAASGGCTRCQPHDGRQGPVSPASPPCRGTPSTGRRIPSPMARDAPPRTRPGRSRTGSPSSFPGSGSRSKGPKTLASCSPAAAPPSTPNIQGLRLQT